jgi:hypothetical protein
MPYANDPKNEFFDPLTRIIAIAENVLRKNIREVNPNIIKNFKYISYSTLELIEDLRNEVAKLVPTELYRGKLAYWKLSKYLYDINSKKGYDYIQQSILPRFKQHRKNLYNPNFQLSLDVLEQFKKNLLKNFGENCNKAIEFIDKYKVANYGLKEYSSQQWHIHNPNLNITYFNTINTVKKAYWLGFLMADGSIIKKKFYYVNGQKRSRISTKTEIFIELSAKDRILLDRFCDEIRINKKKIKERKRAHYRSGKLHKYVYLRFGCKKMIEDLKSQEFTSSKANRKSLPLFIRRDEADKKQKLKEKSLKINLIPTSRELVLAWLRGYYDGDGISNTTRIIAANKQFLVKIKNTIKIKNPVAKIAKSRIYNDKYGKKHTIRAQYSLTIGARLFNEMSSIFKHYKVPLLKRKDKYFNESREGLDILKEKLENMRIEKIRLQELVYQYQQYKIIEMLGTSETIFRSLRSEWGIQLPPNGYWKNKDKNKSLGKHRKNSKR